jgi:hypothetical protein
MFIYSTRLTLTFNSPLSSGNWLPIILYYTLQHGFANTITNVVCFGLGREDEETR